MTLSLGHLKKPVPCGLNQINLILPALSYVSVCISEGLSIKITYAHVQRFKPTYGQGQYLVIC